MLKLFPPLQKLNIPCLMTSSSVIFSISSLFLVTRSINYFPLALLLLTISVLLDTLDGVVARKLNQSSSFGKELDSLADIISFGVTPPLIAFLIGLNTLYHAVFFILFVLASFWRLAYFNLEGMEGEGKNSSFIGFPTTIIAATFIFLGSITIWFPREIQQLALTIFFTGAPFLLISCIKFKKRGFIARSFMYMTPFILLSLVFFMVTH